MCRNRPASGRSATIAAPAAQRRRGTGAARHHTRRTRATKHPADRDRGRHGRTHPHRLRFGRRRRRRGRRRRRVRRRHRHVGRGLRRDGRPGRGRAGGGHAQRHRAARRTGRTTARCSTPSARSTTSRSTAPTPTAPARTSSTPSPARSGQDRAPDVLDLGTAFARQAQAQDLLAPYQVATWDEIPEDQKDPDGHWYNDYGGYISIGCNASVIAECPTSFEALLDPQYAGQVALNGNPTQAAAAFAGVWAASLANGGRPRRHRPGHRLLRRRQGGRQLQPGRDHPGHDPERRDAAGHRLGLPQRRAHRDPRRAGRRVGGRTCPATALFGGYYSQAISKFAPHPAAARLWQEFLYSDEGQNIWLEGRRPPGPAARDGGGRHRRRGGALGAARRSRARPSSRPQEQETAAQQVVADRWNEEISG